MKRAGLVTMLAQCAVAAAWVLSPCVVWAAEGGGSAVFDNGCLRWVIDANGRNRGFIDRATGDDLCRKEPATVVARVRVGGQWHDASAVNVTGDAVSVAFSGTDATVTLRVTTHKRHFVVEVVGAEGAVEELQFPNLQLTLKGTSQEDFAGCALALNLQTNVATMPGPSDRIAASCVARFGITGASLAVVGCRRGDLRDVLKEVVSAAPSLPHSPVGGPWAMDAPINRASYLFANPTEANVDEVIRTVQSVGFNQIEIHGGRATYRFGDCFPNPALYPNGVASIRAVIDRCHAAGILVGMHPYSFFIDKATPWVTPVPDPGLAWDTCFTLSADLSAQAETVPVTESTAGMSTTTGFFVRNSVLLRIGEEIISYSAVAKEPPYAFLQCKRGALGTRASAHPAGEKVYHLRECFGLLAPDPDSSLFEKVVAAQAQFFNDCGFDTIYLDALDGEDVLGGSQYSWHYGSKYVWELWKRLARPAAMEYSTFHHHLWVLRSRHGAWDHPSRSYRQFVDLHVAANQNNERMFLPSNLGWWAFKSWQPPQCEPTFPEDIEYWCAKGLGTDSGLSLQGYDPSAPGHQRLAAIVKRYEELRRAGCLPEAVKAQLREPGAAFTLESSADGAWKLWRLGVAKHTFSGSGGPAAQVTNPYAAQAPSVRIETLMSAAPYDAPEVVELVNCTRQDQFPIRGAAPAVKADLQVLAADPPAVRLTAVNSSASRRGTWAKFGKTFDPPLNLSKQQGLGVWVCGDGKGEVLNFQVQSPTHITGALGEHYVIVDFEGWRYFELIEHDADRYADYAWPYGGGYAIYRELVNYTAIGALTLWCNNLPPNDSIQVDLRPVRALPLLPGQVNNVRLSVGGEAVTVPAPIASGNYVELDPSGKGTLYGPKGETLGRVQASGPLPTLAAGINSLSLTCEGQTPPSPRVRVTVLMRGGAL